MKWGVGKIGFEKEAIIVGGLNPWEFVWTKLDEEPVNLPHPSHRHELHKLWLYRIENEGILVTFAAGELSANVWGFYERYE